MSPRRLRMISIAMTAWRGKWVVLVPSLTLCHEVCPMTTTALNQLTAAVRRAGVSQQVVVAEATVDPWRDTPARLRAYKRLTGAGFPMLTGSQAAIRWLWKFFGVYYHRVAPDKPADVDWLTHKPETFDVNHTDAVFLIDPAGRERIVYEGMPDAGGHAPPVQLSLLNDQGRHNLAHPQFPWTAAEVLQDLYYLMNRSVPPGALPKVSPPSAAAKYGRRVAFLGADINDDAGNARSFLASHPVSYPSCPASDLSPFAVLQAVPTTVFVSAAGKVVGVHTGQYGTEAALENDVQRYAFGS